MQTKKNLNLKVPENLPKPTGYRMIIVMPKLEEKTAGGIIIPDQRRDEESTAGVIAYVAAMGPDCYSDEQHFSEPWCKVGDWVVITKYAGSMLKIDGIECRIVNDNGILAVCDDPNSVQRGGL